MRPAVLSPTRLASATELRSRIVLYAWFSPEPEFRTQGDETPVVTATRDSDCTSASGPPVDRAA